MDWIRRLEEALDYIERHLDGEIDYKKAAQIACCSEYHLSRMFSYMTDVTLSEYIRRRRLTYAALDIQSGDVKMIDIAVKYGYESADAFSRAFKKNNMASTHLRLSKEVANYVLTQGCLLSFRLKVKRVCPIV